MSNIQFTDRQKRAIDAPVADILVSAAAGSGKTAVLTERIVRNVINKENPVSISDMLIVTFTKAAASELRTRIGKAISEECAKNPEDRYLRRQLMLVENAHISTIHSFCADVVKAYSSTLGLPVRMRVADASETKLMRTDMIERVIEQKFETGGDAFNEFAENFESLREGRLSKTLLSLYEKLESYTEGIEYIKKSGEVFGNIALNGLSNSGFDKQIITHIRRIAGHFGKICENAVAYLISSELTSYNRQAEVFENDKLLFDRLSVSDSIDSLRDILLDYGFTTLKTVKSSDKCEEYDELIEIRNKYKKVISEFTSSFLKTDEEKIRKSAARSKVFCDQLYGIMSMLDDAIMQEKTERGILDFSDLEKYAYKLFYDKDGNVSSAAKETASSFKQIYIDEYQDVSPIQDRIFRAIGSNNIFIVGDIKQSIYSFRGSAPELFANYRSAYPEYNPDINDQNCFKIFLTENFRCDESVIRFSNRVFECLFNNNSGRVPYLREDALKYGKDPGSDAHEKVTIALVKYDDKTKESAEAEYVASEISGLISSGVRPGDIAIILRSMKNRADQFKNALENRGIRYVTTTKRDLLAEPEIMLIVSCLKCIDDPESDISLASVLKSPLFGFSLDDLAILASDKEKNLYLALKAHINDSDKLGEKCRDFEDWHKRSRFYASAHSVSEILRYLFGNCSLEVLIKATSDMPSTAQDNINSFCTLARGFEANSFKGLHIFIKYINEMKDRKVIADGSDGPSDDLDSVKLITAHQSKGLEFKVCFVSGTSKKANNNDSTQNLLIDRELGISLKLNDDSGFVRYDTVMRKAGAIHVTESLIDDEMRILYVALTRAKNKLYVTAGTPDPDKLLNDCRKLASVRSYYAYMTSRCYIEWILSSLDAHDIDEFCKIEVIDDRSDIPAEIISREPETINVSGVDTERIRRHIDFRYKWEAARDLPSKIAVSVLYPGVLDDYKDRMSGRMNAFPRFLEGEKNPTSAERGTATHLFMQFCDFERAENCGIEKEIENLIELGFITKETAALIYKEKLGSFFTSDLYKTIRRSPSVMREYRFNVKMPAKDFTEDADLAKKLGEEEILVQGVIDCFFESDDHNYVIVDYKTDRIKSEGSLADEYRLQLGYYKYALEKLTGRKVGKTVIFAFDTGSEIVIDF